MQSTITLNIGLLVDSSGAHNTVGRTVEELERAGFAILALRVDQSDSERTVIAVVKPTHNRGLFFHVVCGAIARVSDALDQDCIAVWEPASARGLLLGRRPYASGFLPEYFLTLDGTRLSETQATV